jgi:hypothetical protein
METKLKVRNESFPERCDICHQFDFFDPQTGFCERCKNVKAISVHSKPMISSMVENYPEFSKVVEKGGSEMKWWSANLTEDQEKGIFGFLLYLPIIGSFILYLTSPTFNTFLYKRFDNNWLAFTALLVCCWVISIIIPISLIIDNIKKGGYAWKRCNSALCSIFKHRWDGCNCRRCGAAMDHQWVGCKCKICGTSKFHQWKPGEYKDTNSCILAFECSCCGKKDAWLQHKYERSVVKDGLEKYICNRCGDERIEKCEWCGKPVVEYINSARAGCINCGGSGQVVYS